MIKVIKKNKELKVIAYLDVHTGLPNKSKCNEVLKDVNIVDLKTSFVMFDLNYLKKVNDTLGHDVGDILIQNFAKILKNRLNTSSDFVGRFGGDEFIAILKNRSKQQLINDLKQIEADVNKYNSINTQVLISYAYGYACACDYENATLQSLLKIADDNMYINKKKYYEETEKNTS